PPHRLHLDDREETSMQEGIVLIDREIGLAADRQLLTILDAVPLPAELDRNRRRHRQPSPLSSRLFVMDEPYPSLRLKTYLCRGDRVAVGIDRPHLDAALGQLRRDLQDE